MKLTTDTHLVPMLKINQGILLLPLHVSMEYTGKTVPVPRPMSKEQEKTINSHNYMSVMPEN